jgi:hypothetical protein
LTAAEGKKALAGCASRTAAILYGSVLHAKLPPAAFAVGYSSP